jgi:protein SCO1/2
MVSVRRQLTLWALVALAVLGGVIGRTVSGHPTAPRTPLPVRGAVPTFSLTDQDGHAISHEALVGHVWIADFIFTSCPGQCLLMTDQFNALQRTFAGAEGLRFVSFSVDPSHDTPEVLAAYATRHGADPRWRLLTGEREAIFTLCRDGFGLAVDDASGTTSEPITHSVRLVLVDRTGRMRGTYDATDAQAMGRLRRDVRQLLEDAG